MKKFVKRKNILKEAGILLIVSILLFSNLFATAHIVIDRSTKATQNNKLSTLYSGLSSKYKRIIETSLLDGYEIILDESFKNSEFPPDWTHNVTNPSATWQIEYDEDECHSEPYYATCYNNLYLQDEWLITQSLNFSKYDEVRLSFFWKMQWWYAASADLCDLNVSISTDGGKTWGESIWCEDKYKDEGFDNWFWYDTNKGNHIDLSKYTGENYTNVKIRFQYFSDNGSNGCQIYLDDILIYGNDPSPNPLICDANGPYEVKAGEYVYFRCNVSGGTPFYYYKWDFGDSTPYTIENYQKFPRHQYNIMGPFNVTLRVTDSRLPKGRIFFANTSVIIGEPEHQPPKLKICNISDGIGLKVNIKNGESFNLTDINWEIYARGGPLGINIFDHKQNGTINNLVPGESKMIRLKYFVGFGTMHIKITAQAAGIVADPLEKKALKFGPFWHLYKKL